MHISFLLLIITPEGKENGWEKMKEIVSVYVNVLQIKKVFSINF